MSEFLLKIKEEAGNIDAAMREDLAAVTMDILLRDVLDYGLFSGGKRVRPLLAVTSARLCGFSGDEVYQVGIAFEYLHAATLFHDDIIDQSDLRRGRPSIHKKFGVVAAILAGDFLHAHSMERISRFCGRKGLFCFCEATKGMVEGEFLQLANTENYNLGEDDYYAAIMGKTGLLISAACEVGAMYGGGRVEQIQALKHYGEKIGCAFQVIDDLLDYQGDAAKTGKKIGNDLVEGKMTLPLILALKNADPADNKRLKEILMNTELRKKSFAEVYHFLDKYEGFNMARSVAERFIAEAVDSLSIFTSGKCLESKKLLTGLAQYILSRKK